MIAEIYSKNGCSYCEKAKTLLKEKNVEYIEYIISPGFGENTPGSNQRYVTKEQLLEKAPNAKTVPQIWLEGSYVGGFNELDAFFKKNNR